MSDDIHNDKIKIDRNLETKNKIKRINKKIKSKPKLVIYYTRHVGEHLLLCVKWIFLSCIVGIVVGGFSTLFAYSMGKVTTFREQNPNIIFLLPVAGLFIVFLYRVFDYKNDKGTNLVLSTIHAQAEVPTKMAPLIFISTVITHLFGGSAGREGAALQLGGSIGNFLGKILKLDDRDKRVIVMCGMSAAFAAVFGTPMAAAIFAMEVVSVGVMYYAALVPCVFSVLIASKFASNMGISSDTFTINNIPELSILSGSEILLLSILCAGLSVIFCIILHKFGDLYRKYIKNPYYRIFFAGVIIVLATLILQTTDYNGAGVEVIEKAMKGEVVPYAFIAKMILTAITIEAGFKGGEIVPSFFIGATFGCVFGNLIGLSPSLCAAVGMISVFCGVTNCPITSILISFELFGFEAVPYFLIAASISYLLSGYYGLYNDQTIVYSKYKTLFINRKAR